MIQMKSTQEILLDKSGVGSLLRNLEYKNYPIPEEFYSKGYCLIKDVKNEKDAQVVLEKFISSIDTDRLPIYKSFLPKIQLAKKDEIPVCDDSVETSFQALHFDMGQPMMSLEPQNMFLITGLYIAAGQTPKTAATRVINLRGLLKDPKFGTVEEIDEKILGYVKKHGDGWTYPDKVNTFRISCFARIMDAVAGTEELADYFDKSMAQWFQDPDNKNGHHSKDGEKEFYAKRGIDLDTIEEDLVLKPGEILVVDNMRTAHGRIGKRDARETLQFMYGVSDAAPSEIDQFRKQLVKLMAG